MAIKDSEEDTETKSVNVQGSWFGGEGGRVGETQIAKSRIIRYRGTLIFWRPKLIDVKCSSVEVITHEENKIYKMIKCCSLLIKEDIGKLL